MQPTQNKTIKINYEQGSLKINTMATLFSLLFFASIILLFIGFFNPKKSLFWDKQERTSKKSSLIYGGLAALSLIAFAKVNDAAKQNTSASIYEQVDSTNEENQSSSNETQSNTDNEATVNTPQFSNIGDQVEVGHFSYIVNKARFAKSVGDSYSKETADGIFLIINLTFRNNDNEEHTLDNSLFKLTDEAGTEFSTSSNGEMVLETSGNKSLFLKECNPQITKSGFLIFEVPDVKDYYLHLSGGFWNGKTAIVTITKK